MAGKTYTIGIKLESNAKYDELMDNHSQKDYFGMVLNFKGLFQGYPTDYPCLVEYVVGSNPISDFMLNDQLAKIVEAGYLVQIKTE